MPAIAGFIPPPCSNYIMLKLNAQTPRGKKALEWARKGLRAWARENPKYCYISTKENTYADIDAIVGIPSVKFPTDVDTNVAAHMLYVGAELDHVMEAKARDMTKAKLFGAYGGKWLVSKDKLERGRDVAYALRTDFYGLLVLVPDKVCYYTILAKYSEEDGGLKWVIPFEVMKTETQKNINGGTAFRENAYIDMREVEEIEI